jgi:hypothetical protein
LVMLTEWTMKDWRVKFFANPIQESRSRGRLRSRWWDFVYGDITKCNIRNWEQRSKKEKTG